MDKRQSRRQRVFQKGQLVLAGSHSIECVLKNWSETGALISVQGVAALPENFILSVPQRSVRIPVRIAWRGDDQIGVQFVVAAASNSAPRAGDLEAEIERLRARIREMERVAREAGVEYIFNRDVA